MISRTGLHSIRALAQLAQLPNGEFAGAALLAAEIGAPQNYLGKLLQAMTRSGLVESRKGQHGGFRLARDPRSISLLEVLDPIEHVSRWDGCLLGHQQCSDDTACCVHSRWSAVRDNYLKMLKTTTIADVLGDYGGVADRPTRRHS